MFLKIQRIHRDVENEYLEADKVEFLFDMWAS